MIDVIQIVTATSDRDEADRIGQALLERRLAACVQISGPVDSRYWWKEKIETSREWVCTIKTLRSLYERVEEAIRELHSYEEPEVLAMETTAASHGFLRWVADVVEEPLS